MYLEENREGWKWKNGALAIMSKSASASAPHSDAPCCTGVRARSEQDFSITKVSPHMNHMASTVPTTSPPHPWVLQGSTAPGSQLWRDETP